MTTWTWVEPFAGGAACSLRLVGGRDLVPPVSWMGGKRRLARVILDAMGVPDSPPSRVLLADAGPWGWVWPLLLAPTSAAEVARVLRSWAGEHPRDLWRRLVAQPPAEDLHERAAQWLWLQARSASGVPIWWDGWRHVMGKTEGRTATQPAWQKGDGGPADDKGEDMRWPGHQAQRAEWLASDGRGQPRPAGARAVGGRWEKGTPDARPPQDATNGQRGSWRFDARPGDVAPDRAAGQAGRTSDPGWRMGEEVKKALRGTRTLSEKGTSRGKTGGMVNPVTIADRAEAIAEAFADVDATVHHGDARELLVLALRFAIAGGLFCYLDPPYVGATGYGWDMPRAEVLALARRWHDAGAVVAVSEAVPLHLPGWNSIELTREGGKPEWITLSRTSARFPARQGVLFGEPT